MASKRFLVSGTPHIRRHTSTEFQYLMIILALIPCVVASIVIHTFSALLILSVAVLACYVFDIVFSHIFLGHFSFRDFSSVITGMILGLVMPAKVPVFFVLIAAVIATLISKVLFGGEGKELVNPAGFGASVLAALVVGFGTTLVAYSSANGEIVSPFVNFADGDYGTVPILDLFLGHGGGMIGTTCAIACIAGGVLLMATSVFDFYIPLLSIIAFVVTTVVTKGGAGVIPELLSGSFLFVSFFMLPSHSSSPALWPAKTIYAILFGILAGLVRESYLFGEAGVFFCLILMNIISPFLDMVLSILFRGRRSKKYE